jgi:hypothetical protein
MILSDYYYFEHLPECKSTTRFDCTASTKSNPDFEIMRNKEGRLFLYYGDVPENFKADAKRKADKVLTKTKSISSVYVPDVSKPLAFGDVRGTKDAILFVFNTDATAFELYVARGQKNNRGALYNLLADGELTDEIAELKQRAVTETVTT